MKIPTSRWGIYLFLSAVPFIAVAAVVLISFPVRANTTLYGSILPIGIFSISVLCAIFGHLSYFRIQSIKLLCLGYCAAISGIALCSATLTAVVQVFPLVSNGFLPIVLMVMCFNLAGISFLPAHLPYRVAQRLVLSVVLVEGIGFLLLRLIAPMADWAQVAQCTKALQWQIFIGAGWLGAVVLITWIVLRNEFYLGGILAGAGLIGAMLWYAPLLPGAGQSAAIVLFAAMFCFLCFAIIIHWFVRMEHRIAYDPLLHIYNRDYCSKVISEQSRLDVTPPFGLAMVDIDHFKNVNDTYGHQTGDQVLILVAQTIHKTVGAQGVVCRYGGEELIVFFPKLTTKEVVPIIENVRIAVSKAKTPTSKKPLAVTVSCGVTHREALSQSIMDVIHTADKALYKAKNEGRNQVKSAKTPL